MIAKDRLNTVKNEINSLEAEVLASSTNSSVAKTKHASSYGYGDPNALAAFMEQHQMKVMRTCRASE